MEDVVQRWVHYLKISSTKARIVIFSRKPLSCSTICGRLFKVDAYFTHKSSYLCKSPLLKAFSISSNHAYDPPSKTFICMELRILKITYCTTAQMGLSWGSFFNTIWGTEVSKSMTASLSSLRLSEEQICENTRDHPLCKMRSKLQHANHAWYNFLGHCKIFTTIMTTKKTISWQCMGYQRSCSVQM